MMIMDYGFLGQEFVQVLEIFSFVGTFFIRHAIYGS